MTLPDFLTGLAMELRLRGQPFDSAALERFASSVWPLADEDPEAGRWATAFLASQDLFYDINDGREGIRADQWRLMNDDCTLVAAPPDEMFTLFLDLEDWTPGEPIAGLVAEQRTICPD